ncbi:MAG: LacI family DNA-binding transcriptional regulator [Chthonomonadales bacterium]|nr:LacI family DNA-binding transcriptional regulator [Chthonomonadales bacterium]
MAVRAGVHCSTASHVLNGARGSTRVSDGTRRRLQQVAADLGYVPSRPAQTLRTRQSRVVGLLTGSLENPFFARMVSLCSEELERGGYDVVLAVRRSDEPTDLHLLRALNSRQLDGILLWSETSSEVRERVQRPDMATTVVMGYRIPCRASVSGDLEVGVREAMRHLVAGGCRRIAYFALDLAIRREGDPRHDVYCDEVTARGLAPHVITYDGLAFDVGAARECGERLASGRGPLPDALLCFNDVAAMGALMGLRRQGVRIPDDIALVGCDDLPLAAELDVPLTSIAYPLGEMCRTAVDLLLERVQAAEGLAALPPCHVLLPTELRIRASSVPKPPPTVGELAERRPAAPRRPHPRREP